MRQEGLLCDGCNRWNHRTCNTGVSRTQYREAIRNDVDIDWQCKDCRITQLDQLAPPPPSPQLLISSSPTSTVQLFDESDNDSSLEDPSVGDVEPQPPAPITYEFVEHGSIRKKINKTTTATSPASPTTILRHVIF